MAVALAVQVCGPDFAAVSIDAFATRFWLQPKDAMLQTTLQRGAVLEVLRNLQLCENLLRVLSTSLRAATNFVDGEGG